MAGNIEHKVMVYRHDAKTSAVPWLIQIGSEAFRHLVKTGYALFQAFQLTNRILNGLQLIGDIFKNTAKVIICLRCDLNIVGHTS